eukprot:CAMPEP_0184501836 /NCGR_PEP_ID=MMETSP0113_2-20130426/48696_1 /TAXON_ID=91329 /ORGANISM="Norrisiella sphaerica, Strain BC52" /LENGTH=78 /DNA_ID=CAMNT_0026890741 /DNA_START=289 /DNA_END=525 /DNA_ORIENTATION=+
MRCKLLRGKQAASPFVSHVMHEVAHLIDRDGDKKVTREEFDDFGNYLHEEYLKLEASLAGGENEAEIETPAHEEYPNF